MDNYEKTKEFKRAYNEAERERDRKLENGTWDEEKDGEKPPRGIFTPIDDKQEVSK